MYITYENIYREREGRVRGQEKAVRNPETFFLIGVFQLGFLFGCTHT